jgi:AcrR family transcriptional regulator
METQLQQPLVRKERERLARRQEILRTARQVFARRGYENATLDEIAEKAEFAKGTLYNYFDSKEVLFGEIIESAMNDVTRLAGETINAGGAVRERFHTFALRMMEYFKANEDLLRILLRELNQILLERQLAQITEHARNIASVLAAALRKEIQRRAVIKEDPLELANIFVGMIHDRVMRYSLEQKDLAALDVKKEAALVVRLFFDGAALP